MIWENSVIFSLDDRLKKSYYWKENYNAFLISHKEGTNVWLVESKCEGTGKSLWGECSSQSRGGE